MGVRRINIQVSDRINEQLDHLSEVYGIPKSSIAALGIGQYVEGLIKQREMMYGANGFMENVKQMIQEKAKNIMEEEPAHGA